MTGKVLCGRAKTQGAQHWFGALVWANTRPHMLANNPESFVWMGIEGEKLEKQASAVAGKQSYEAEQEEAPVPLEQP